jgi:hypothetical protein
MKSHHAKLTANQEANVTKIQAYLDTQLNDFKDTIQKDFENLKKDHEAKSQNLLEKISEQLQVMEAKITGPRG